MMVTVAKTLIIILFIKPQTETIKILVDIIVTVMSINDKVLVKKDFVIHWILFLDYIIMTIVLVGASICYNNYYDVLNIFEHL